MVFKAYTLDPIPRRPPAIKTVAVARRSLLGKGGALALGLALRPSGARAEPRAPIRISLSSPGSAGSIWKPLAAQMADAVGDLDLQWTGADPGQMQVQLMAGTLDVGSFGSVGLATSALKGGDIVLFGPGLNNHGRWIVRGDSAYASPQDLIGKRIAMQPKTSETYNQAHIAATLAGLDLPRQFEIIFGPPTANVALFERGDVEAVVAIEPTATRLIGRGAREIARVGDMWQKGTGTSEPPFLVGLAATRRWVDANRDAATRLARLFAAMNHRLHEKPDLFATFSRDMGVKPDEQEAIRLLPARMPSIYATRWDASVWSAIDTQIDVAIRSGALPGRPRQPLYDGQALNS